MVLSVFLLKGIRYIQNLQIEFPEFLFTASTCISKHKNKKKDQGYRARFFAIRCRKMAFQANVEYFEATKKQDL